MGNNGEYSNWKIAAWKNTLEELRMKREFNPDDVRDAQKLNKLKDDVYDAYLNCGRKVSISSKAFWISVLVAAIGFVLFFITLRSNESIAPNFFALGILGVLAAVAIKKVWIKNIEDELEEILDFDGRYFNGELRYKTRK